MGNIEALWHIMQRRLFLKVQIVVLFNSKHHFQLQLEWIYLYCLYLNKKNECDYTGRNFFQVCVLSTIWFCTEGQQCYKNAIMGGVDYSPPLSQMENPSMQYIYAVRIFGIILKYFISQLQQGHCASFCVSNFLINLTN